MTESATSSLVDSCGLLLPDAVAIERAVTGVPTEEDAQTQVDDVPGRGDPDTGEPTHRLLPRRRSAFIPAGR